jgi:hypothetical protein
MSAITLLSSPGKRGFPVMTRKHAKNNPQKKEKRKEAQACESGLEPYSGCF